MLLPRKHLRIRHSALGIGAAILHRLPPSQSVDIDSLWEQYQAGGEPHIHFADFVRALSLLYALGVVESNEHGEVHRATR
jgi:hypothetical protein